MSTAVQVLDEPLWGDPPDALTGGAAEYTVKLAPARRLLRDRPREWAMVATAGTSQRAAKMATNIRAGKYGFRLTELWESCSRLLDDGDSYGVFVRYLGIAEGVQTTNHGPQAVERCRAVWPAPAGFRGVVVCTEDAGHVGQHRSPTKTWDDAGNTRAEPTADPAPAAPTAGADEVPSAAAPAPPSPAAAVESPPSASGQPKPAVAIKRRVTECGRHDPTSGMGCRLGGDHDGPHKGWSRSGTRTWTDAGPASQLEPEGSPLTHRTITETPASVEVSVPLDQVDPGMTALLLGTDAEPGESSRDVAQRVHAEVVAQDAAKVKHDNSDRLLDAPRNNVRTYLPEPLPPVRICTCGHPPRSHEPDSGPCRIWTCDCTGLRLAQQLDT